MTPKLFSKITKFLILIVVVASSFSLTAQPDCRTEVVSHLSPISKAIPIRWAAEFAIAQGWMNDRDITNASIYLGVEYSLSNHTIYFEGGRKSWRNSLGFKKDADNPDGFFQKNRFGLREAYYDFDNRKTALKIGFQTLKINDYFLVDERVFAINFVQKIGAFTLNTSIASGIKDLARMGSFCGVKYIYNTIKQRDYLMLGDAFGETNFASATLSFDPSETKKSGNSEDEFSEFNEFSSSENEKEQFLKESGLVLYYEFGSGYEFTKFYPGVFAEFQLPFKIIAKSEALVQIANSNNAVIPYLKLRRNFQWKSKQNTTITLGYVGKINIDKNAHGYFSFSNLFMGEVMRLDAYDLPILFSEIKHKFPGKLKPYFKFRSATQLESNRTNEFDFYAGIKIINTFKLTGIFSRITSNAFPDVKYLARVELRVTI